MRHSDDGMIYLDEKNGEPVQNSKRFQYLPLVGGVIVVILACSPQLFVSYQQAIKQQQIVRTRKVEEVISTYDKDGDGELGPKELSAYVSELILKSHDKDGNNKLSKEELSTLVR